MKLIKANGNVFLFELARREKELLAAVLKMYPLLNPDYHRVANNKADPRIKETQELLFEAMAQQKATGKKAVSDFLEETNWTPIPGGASQVALNAEKMEWLLQVLNDVRVGSWVKLGKPDTQHGDKLDSKIENLPYIGAMELCGLFQSVLLEALEL